MTDHIYRMQDFQPPSSYVVSSMLEKELVADSRLDEDLSDRVEMCKVKVKNFLREKLREFDQLGLDSLDHSGDSAIDTVHCHTIIGSYPSSTATTQTTVVEQNARGWKEQHGTIRTTSIGHNIIGLYDAISDLYDVISDLDEAQSEAQEEGFPIPSDTALENAHRLLLGMYSIYSRRFEVYPTPDGEIAIDVPSGFGHSVLLLCDSDGGALCMVNMAGAHRRARYSDTNQLPDGFIREALNELQSKSNYSL